MACPADRRVGERSADQIEDAASGGREGGNAGTVVRIRTIIATGRFVGGADVAGGARTKAVLGVELEDKSSTTVERVARR